MHGGHKETSIHLSIVPNLVKMKEIVPGRGVSKKRLDHLPGIATPVSWYANFPHHYSGDARPATRQAGELLWQMRIRAVAKIIREVKRDKMGPKLMKEFYAKVNHKFI
jgi:creatinine amidohydrolase